MANGAPAQPSVGYAGTATALAECSDFGCWSIAANNPAVRPHYLKTLEGIPGKVDGSLPIRDRALQAFQLRNAAVAESVR